MPCSINQHQNLKNSMTILRLPVPILAAILLCGGPAFAQDDVGKGPRPAPQAEEASPADAGELELDPSRFGEVIDEAYGAYQRGYYLTAYRLALPRAERGDGAAQTLVAELLANGLGIRQDLREATKWYEKAANKGVPDAQLQYALLLVDGQLVKPDREKAFDLMRKAADAGKPLAQFNLAQMLVDSGKFAEAVGWYEKAANAKLADAQYAMAQVYAEGVGGKPQDLAEARRWLELAAKNKFDTAQLDFGTWLVEGRGGPVDFAEGFAWLKRAADAGNIAAHNRVAKLYLAGVGVNADPIAAAAWYMRARQAGLIDKAMEDFLEGLTEEQVQQATERMETLR